MSQDAIQVQSGTGLEVRTAINKALLTLASSYAGPAQPDPIYPYMWWLDTTNSLVKQAKGDASGFITKGVLLADGTIRWDGITATQFDNTTKLATTAFVQQSLGNLAGQSFINTTPYTVNANQAGKLLEFSTGASVVNLPAVSALPVGAAFTFTMLSVGSIIINTNGTDTIDGIGGTSVSSLIVGRHEFVTLIKVAAGQWYAIGTTSEILASSNGFSASLTGVGYQKLPSGIIIQWGTIPIGTSVPVTFPVAFSSSVYVVDVFDGGYYNGAIQFGTTSITTSGFTARSNIATEGMAYIAIGK